MARSSTTWKKGQVTNPKGRPPRPSFRDLIEKLPDKLKNWQHPDADVELPPEQAVMALILSAAYNGESWALKTAAEYLLGKPMQAIEQTNIDGNENNPFDGLTVDELRTAIDALANAGNKTAKALTRKKKPS